MQSVEKISAWLRQKLVRRTSSEELDELRSKLTGNKIATVQVETTELSLTAGDELNSKKHIVKNIIV